MTPDGNFNPQQTNKENWEMVNKKANITNSVDIYLVAFSLSFFEIKLQIEIITNSVLLGL